ncbi:MAG: MarR family transcriptional regulator [Gemmatimonas sp.]
MMTTRLQQEIKQTSPFRSPEAETFLNIVRTSAALVRGLAQVLRPYDITQPQYNALRILRGAGADGLLRGEVGERMVTHEPDVTRLLDRMEARGLVHRERGVGDRRLVHVRITVDGLTLLAALDEPVHAMHCTQLGHLGSSDLASLNGLLERARASSRAQDSQ